MLCPIFMLFLFLHVNFSQDGTSLSASGGLFSTTPETMELHRRFVRARLFLKIGLRNRWCWTLRFREESWGQQCSQFDNLSAKAVFQSQSQYASNRLLIVSPRIVAGEKVQGVTTGECSFNNHSTANQSSLALFTQASISRFIPKTMISRFVELQIR